MVNRINIFKKDRKGISILSILVVIAIIGLLFAIISARIRHMKQKIEKMRTPTTQVAPQEQQKASK
jgi:type II secretory pathway pseudopilin PulG